MNQDSSYFFCGVGGSGMLPLAMIVQAQGNRIAGSDRALDQGRTPDKFDWLRAHGVTLHPQDGSGVVSPDQIVVATGAGAAIRTLLTLIDESCVDVSPAVRTAAPEEVPPSETPLSRASSSTS